MFYTGRSSNMEIPVGKGDPRSQCANLNGDIAAMDILSSKRSKIPYLDGLRAYSILIVVLGHAIQPDTWLQRRWYLRTFATDTGLGVRIFFVLSGFLITSLLLKEREATGRISIRGFYERRIARIVPALYLYIAAVAILAAFGVTRVPLASFWAAATFTVNISKVWSLHGPSIQVEVFGHLWTLSVEEQFYLLWPSILVFFGRRWSRRLAIACVVLFPFIRFAIYHYCLDRGIAADFRRAVLFRVVQDVIMWGALGAFAAQAGIVDRMRTHRFRWTYPWIAALILFGFGGAIQTYPYLGLDGILLPALQGLATLLLMFWLLSGEGGLLRRILESWPAVQLGLLSYSLYIWQQLFIMGPEMKWLGFPWNVLFALAAAMISYRLVEVPLRKQIRAWFSQPQAAH
jgi:peptidoglycan/LPS O-acetylase OafA/YrhL